MGRLSESREIDLSMLYYVKDVVLPFGGWVSEKNRAPLSRIGTSRIYSSGIKWWTYSSQATYPVHVYDGVSEIPDNKYVIDYLNGRVTIDVTYSISSQISATFSYDTAHVHDSWDSAVDDSASPVVFIDFMTSRVTPLCLGKSKMVKRDYRIDIRSTDEEICQSIADSVEQGFDFVLPIIDFSSAMPLKSDGTKNPSFDLSSQLISNYSFANVSNSKVRVPEGGYVRNVFVTVVNDRFYGN